ncbi:hypothetical protein [Moraxella lacunata]|uniref:hypothetical protein n=1 Tax=Moraxella lacunata TaxID=477 RepID=UPI003EE0C981
MAGDVSHQTQTSCFGRRVACHLWIRVETYRKNPFSRPFILRHHLTRKTFIIRKTHVSHPKTRLGKAPPTCQFPLSAPIRTAP